VDISDGVSAAPRAGNGREADEERRLLALLSEERGARDVGVVAVASEDAVRAGATGVDGPLRNLCAVISDTTGHDDPIIVAVVTRTLS
jgi:hypothetical protein